jgi:hypothetical protein
VEHKLINHSCVDGGICILVILTQQDATIKNKNKKSIVTAKWTSVLQSGTEQSLFSKAFNNYIAR